ncbi:hypothetical protein GCM10022631_02280 [Deinococcus rubellus]
MTGAMTVTRPPESLRRKEAEIDHAVNFPGSRRTKSQRDTQGLNTCWNHKRQAEVAFEIMKMQSQGRAEQFRHH